MTHFVLSLLCGYLIGSVPTAFLLVQWRSRVDIRAAGSGNVGAMNTFDVTNSRVLAVAVFLVDALKGVLAVLAGSFLGNGAFWIAALAGIGAVIGHNYPVWLKGKGGRGLSTAVGVFAMTSWVVVPAWCVVWFLHFKMSKNIHYANLTASLLTPFLVMLVPASAMVSLGALPADPGSLFLFESAVMLLIVLRHLEFVVGLLKSFAHQP